MLSRAALALLALVAVLALPAAASAEPGKRPLVYAFVLDGLDGDAVDAGKTPFLKSMLEGGAGASSTYYRESRSVMVAETNPNHTAMITGAFPKRSGITGNTFAVYGDIEDEDSCPEGKLRQDRAPQPTSGESASCVEAQSLFQGIERQRRNDKVTTAGIFGKPKLGRLFASRRGGSYDADHLWAPCEQPGDETPYCENVPINPITRFAADDSVVMDEVIRTTREKVEADGKRKRPDFTFVNFPQIDSAGHATGRGATYDTAALQADQQIERFVANQKQLGLWERTVMMVISDHSMDTTPESGKTTIDDRFQAAGIDADDYVIVGNGSAAHVYLADREASGRSKLLERLRRAALDSGGVTEALYRKRNPRDGGRRHTLDKQHPGWGLGGERTGDLLLTHDPGGAFRDTVKGGTPNFLLGNHGGPQTRDNTLAIIGGGDLVRQQSRSRASNTDIAPTAARLLGRRPPADSQGDFLSEAFRGSRLPGGDGGRPRRIGPAAGAVR